MNENVDINRILRILPHRYPFVMVDRVIEYKTYEYLKAIKNVTINENFFTGHFPGKPIMPGVLILEALAQAGGILWSLSKGEKESYNKLTYFAGIDNARFKHVVTPGDQLRLEVTLTKEKGELWRLHSEAYVEDKMACSADLLSVTKDYKE